MKSTKTEGLIVFITDIISLILSYIIGSVGYLVFIKNDIIFFNQYFYRNSLFLIVSFILVQIFLNKKSSMIMQRNNLEELYNVTKNSFYNLIVFSALFFASGRSELASRGVTFVTFGSFVFISFLFRLVIKNHYSKIKNMRRILVVTDSDTKLLQKLIDNINLTKYGRIDAILSLSEAVEFKDYQCFDDVNVMINFASKEIVDEVIFSVDATNSEQIINLVTSIQSMGIQTSFDIPEVSEYGHFNTNVHFVGSSPILTYTLLESEMSLVIKRIIDIIGGVVGSIVALLAIIVIGPLIKLESPGPVIFKQKRVGKNGRYFEIYKLRSMGVDAEARKKELQEHNEVDGHMFKMTNDPRVTKIGKFIRATSLDELPQFFNVLKGDMSLVGTRPPTIQEFKEYLPHHKHRLAMKPGITGMWQVSGRSNITDFEEVVRLDVKYINDFTLGLDFKILAKTFVVVFAKIGSK